MSESQKSDMQVVFMTGTFSREPRMSYTSSNRCFCKIGIGSTRYFDIDGETRSETLFLDGVLWDEQAEFTGKNLRKGDRVFIEASLSSEVWPTLDEGKAHSKLTLKIHRLIPIGWRGNPALDDIEL